MNTKTFLSFIIAVFISACVFGQCENKHPCHYHCEPCGVYIGNIGNNHIKMSLFMNYPMHQGYLENQMHTITGCYYYVKIGAPIQLATNHYLEESPKRYIIEEFYNGKKTGYFVFPPFECEQKFIYGTWYSPDGTRKYPVSLTFDKLQE